jgi:hypothetical protein
VCLDPTSRRAVSDFGKVELQEVAASVSKESLYKISATGLEDDGDSSCEFTI